MTPLTFIIPVRHQDNSPNWSQLKANLAQTVRSIASQTSADWRGIIVANDGADLPDLPPQFSVERVQFPPNLLHDKGSATRDDFLNAFRLDKGRRVLKGMLAAGDTRFFMICDDDDFVSNKIAAFAASHSDALGWKITQGYVWDTGGSWLYRHDDFNHVCGTSLVVRKDLYQLPARFEEADEEFIMTMLGSHYGVADALEKQGRPLQPLPFRGAVYRVASPGSHSQTPGIFQKYILTRNPIQHPLASQRD